ncbi:nicotinate phosphoribosyltransferase family-domain-containing protein [Zopfochytrium polystomum]|nr:nicotinate phosphoribosyltransferase family-domain-containing protein [Zopfochytrium polystomum]
MFPRLPAAVLTDSYKCTHAFIYPEARKMTAYGEFRSSFEKDKADTRIALYGMRYIIEHYVQPKWTQQDVDDAERLFRFHCSNLTDDPEKSKFPFPKDLFEDFIQHNDGHFPVKIESLPEGSVIWPHVPVFQITAEGKYSRLVTYLETILTMVWYPSTVATLSRRCKDLITKAYRTSVDDSAFGSLRTRLHDFGFRGCTSVEQSVIGGTAHLLNFDGTDTLTAAYYAQEYLNNGNPVGFSIPATEHSVMTSYKTERAALMKLLELYGSGACACVMDSYDYVNALDSVLPAVAKYKVHQGGLLVLRPDSGDPVEVVLQALRAGEKTFGSDLNGKGYKVLRGVGVIQGDGINHVTIGQILERVLAEGFAASNVGFGMGGGLLQKVHRDTMSFATKLSHITYQDGSERDVMKMPKTDLGKFSLPGELAVQKDANAVCTVYPKKFLPESSNSLITVYDHGPVYDWPSFDQVRERLEREWESSRQWKQHQPISEALESKIKAIRRSQESMNDADREEAAAEL